MRHRFEALVASALLYGSVGLVLVFFYIPIFTLMAFSLQSGRTLVLPFEGVTFDWYRALFDSDAARGALVNSTVIAGIAMVLSTAIGTAAALAAVRGRFRLKTAWLALATAPLLFPQLILGIVLLLWFSVLGKWLGFYPGMATAIIGHVVYLTPFTLIVVAVQVATLDPTLEQAAGDCGASPWQTWAYVTWPLIWPGVFSAAIFAFLLSWGNFYLTYSLAGSERTLPTFVFAGIATGSSPLYPAMASVVFAPGLVLVIVAVWLARRGRVSRMD